MGRTTIAEAEEAVRKLTRFLENHALQQSLFTALDAASDEKDVFLALAEKLLEPLAGECVLSQEYRQLCEQRCAKLQTANLGMGTPLTWHGMPDARCLTVDLLSATYDYWDEREKSSTAIDGKYNVLSLGGLSQVTGHTVVTSFVHCNTFSKEHHLLPALLINSWDIAAAIYDAEFDVLLHILSLRWRQGRRLRKAYVCLLWLILHHRLFIRPLSDGWKRKRSGLCDIFTNACAIDEYRQLRSTTVKMWTTFSFPEKKRQTSQPPPLAKSWYEQESHKTSRREKKERSSGRGSTHNSSI